ncbi:MAG TPA: T9SS type A sorting domain-containing protein [Chitinophagales bacterium]|nr:T9SS type A sorting domain-containing protein [Chitinophagales bacterium]
MHVRKLLFFILSLVTALAFSLTSLKRNEAKPFHTSQEIAFFKHHPEGPTRNPIDSGQYFLTSISCKGCHGYDTMHHANVAEGGVDINLYDDWESSMMANSAKDPLWRAKVSHEILVDPGHSPELQTQCTSCHAPMGHFTAMYHGAASYTLNDLYNDTLGLNGVACGGCHEIGTQNLGTVFSGDIPYDTSKKEYGPFLNPFTGPMQLYEGLIPTYSAHMNTSAVCSSCHTLISKTADLNGNYNGHTFIEQATYHEWLNSSFPQDSIPCQHCHMPQITDSVVIANNILSLSPRSPFNQHQFVGGNYFMVNLIKQNKTSLNATAPDVDFDSTLAETYRMLTQQALTVHLYLDSISVDTAFFRFQITNKAGHKFPSGYPSRRAVVQFVIVNGNQDTVFQSGVFDGTYEVKNIDDVFEPHYNMINQASQVQIYEMIMGDVNGDFTSVLERADTFLKDNRIPPDGFVSTFPSYDTTKIVGDALNDPDFNKAGINEGTGRDIVHYHIPLSGITGPVNVYAKVFYQSVPPRWVKEMFTYSSAEIDTFKSMYYAADQTPIMVAHDSIPDIVLPTGISNFTSEKSLRILNSLTSHSVMIENKGKLMIYAVKVFESNGTLRYNLSINSEASAVPLQLPQKTGIYLIEIKTNEGNFVFKVVRP